MNKLVSGNNRNIDLGYCKDYDNMQSTPVCFLIKEVSQCIFMHLNIQMLGRIAQVCHEWQIFSQEDFCWRPHFDHTDRKFSYRLTEIIDTSSFKDMIKKAEKNWIKNISQIIESIGEKYEIDMQKVQVATWCKKKDLPTLLAKDYLDSDYASCEKVWCHPIQFSYGEAFQCIISEINSVITWAYMHNSNNECDNLTLEHTSLISAITNLEASSSEVEKFIEKNDGGYTGWHEIIFSALKKEGVIKDFKFSPHGRTFLYFGTPFQLER